MKAFSTRHHGILPILGLGLALSLTQASLPPDARFDAPVAVLTAPQGEELPAVLRALARSVGALPIIHRVPSTLVQLDLERPVPFRTLWPLLLELHELEARWFAGDVVVVMPLGPPPPPAPEPLTVQRLVRLDHADASAVAAVLNASEAQRHDARATIVAEPISNLLLVSANPAVHARIRDLLLELDQPPTRIGVTLWVVELSLQGLEERGIDVNVALGGRLSMGISGSPRFGWETGALLPSVAVDVAILDQLRSGYAERIEEAQLTVLDGHEAKLFVGGRFNLVLGPDEREVVVVPYGLDLVLSPRLLGDGRVLIDLHAQVDDLIARSDLNIGSRSLLSTAIVTPGELLLVAGLRSRALDDQQQRTPGWAELPLLGPLFQRSSARAQARDLLLLIRAELPDGH